MSSLLLILLSAVLVCHYAPELLGGRVFAEVDAFRNTCGIALASSLLIAVVAPLSYLLRSWFGELGIGYLHMFGLVIVILTLAYAAVALMPRAGWTPVRPAFIVLMTANPAVAGVALFTLRMSSIADVVGAGMAAGIAFALLLLMFTTLHARVMQANVPSIFRGAPIALLTTGLMALALMGLTGLIRD